MFGSDTDSTRASTLTFILAFIFAGIIFMTDRGSDRLLLQTQTQAETAISPGLALLSKPIRATESLIANYQDRSRAVEENKALKEELYRLRADKQRSDVMAIKLRSFEQILGVDSSWDLPVKKIAARAVSEVDGPFVRSALINAGRNKGIKKGHPVMTIDGLYGHVLRAGAGSSRVLQLGDLNSRISVMSVRSEARAILSGDNSELPRLAFIDDRADWREGDKVMTSGDDGVLPRGLPVGTVKADEAGAFVVALNITGKNIDWVWVYPFVPIAEPAEITDSAGEGTDNAVIAPEGSGVDPIPETPQAGTP
ncbi:MAG: rod shape-determining protein MreC [Hellea sp.]